VVLTAALPQYLIHEVVECRKDVRRPLTADGIVINEKGDFSMWFVYMNRYLPALKPHEADKFLHLLV